MGVIAERSASGAARSPGPRHVRFSAAGALGLVLAACSDDALAPIAEPPPLPCGEGTRAEGARCVADLPPPPAVKRACGPGTREVRRVCVPDVRGAPTSTTAIWRPAVEVTEEAYGPATGSELAVDSRGDIFVACVLEGYREPSLVVHVSRNGGAHFGRAMRFAPPNGARVTSGAIVAAPDDRLYAAWSVEKRNPTPGGPDRVTARIFGATSSDHGVGWSDPVALAPGGRDVDVAQTAPRLAVAPGGGVYVSWREDDPRRPLDAAGRIAAWGEGEVGAPEDLAPGVDTFEAPLAFDAAGAPLAITSNGSGVEVVRRGGRTPAARIPLVHGGFGARLAGGPGGRLTAILVGPPTYRVGLYAARSLDGGRTFGGLTRVDGGFGPATAVALPATATDALGRTHVMWLDNRSGAWTPYTAWSNDGERFLAAERIGDAEFTEDGDPDRWIGTGGSLVIRGDTRYASWTDSRSGASHVWFSRAPLPPRDAGDVTCGAGTHLEGDVCLRDPPPPPRTSSTSWSLPVALGESQGLDAIRPRIVVTPKGEVFVAVLVAPADRYFTRHIEVWGSSDDGATFERRAEVPAEGFIGHGAVALALDARGRPVIAYPELDGVHDGLFVAPLDARGGLGAPVQVVRTPNVWLADVQLAFGADGRGLVVGTAYFGEETFVTRTSSTGFAPEAVWKVEPPDDAGWLYPVALGHDGGSDPLVVFAQWPTSGLALFRPAAGPDPDGWITALAWSRSFTFSPQAAVAAPRDGKVSMVFADAISRRFEIYATDAEGALDAWTDRRAIRGEVEGSAVAPALARDEQGRLHVLWYDARDGGWALRSGVLDASATRIEDEERIEGHELVDGAASTSAREPAPAAFAVGGGMRHAAWTTTSGFRSIVWVSSSPAP